LSLSWPAAEREARGHNERDMWVPSRRLRLLGLASLAVLAVFVAAVITYSSVALARFGRVEARRATLMYAAPQPLVAGLHVRRADLACTLARLTDLQST